MGSNCITGRDKLNVTRLFLSLSSMIIIRGIRQDTFDTEAGAMRVLNPNVSSFRFFAVKLSYSQILKNRTFCATAMILSMIHVFDTDPFFVSTYSRYILCTFTIFMKTPKRIILFLHAANNKSSLSLGRLRVPKSKVNSFGIVYPQILRGLFNYYVISGGHRFTPWLRFEPSTSALTGDYT